ncbi:glycosyltransferase family 2 protein [Chitinophaga silvatica]|uniref:Glycosyltransferase family 2 protein n=1 Tax=Chitinophaga silvatica TaxID=2282649 RepID=A0A3E1Y2G7_9BACT|nr:glycosyltransferase family 2 protein [Chitinophaga silvatica]RFS18717.1 glycosyltransferase family 2 protein [Chitinophaga silvatica]
MELAPIVLFVYNRPDLTLSTLQHLNQNKEAGESTLYVYCDGPKANASPEQRTQINKVREIVRSKQWCKEVVILAAEQNKGLATAVIDGVTEVIARHGRVIVLEDDLTVSPYFLKFMNDGLNKYADEEKVMAVHGYLYPATLPASETASTFLIHDPGSLGWGTWARAWNKFEPDTEKVIEQIKAKRLKRQFDFWGAYPFFRMLHQHKNGKVSSWAIRWRGTAYIHDMLTLYPNRSLVRHDGNVAAATHHFKEEDWLYTEIYQHEIPVNDIPVKNNEKMEKVFADFLRYNAGMTISAKIKNRLKQYWKKIAGS